MRESNRIWSRNSGRYIKQEEELMADRIQRESVSIRQCWCENYKKDGKYKKERIREKVNKGELQKMVDKFDKFNSREINEKKKKQRMREKVEKEENQKMAKVFDKFGSREINGETKKQIMREKVNKGEPQTMVEKFDKFKSRKINGEKKKRENERCIKEKFGTWRYLINSRDEKLMGRRKKRRDYRKGG